jgi:hypothetical protein
MRRHGWLTVLLLTAIASGACRLGIGATTEPGRERLPGPASVVIRVMPPELRDLRRIVVLRDDGRMILLPSHADGDRFLSGTTLPAMVSAPVDGNGCAGGIDVRSDLEYDLTLQIDEASCSLVLERSHPSNAIDHRLVDDAPAPSPRVEPTG